MIKVSNSFVCNFMIMPFAGIILLCITGFVIKLSYLGYTALDMKIYEQKHKITLIKKGDFSVFETDNYNECLEKAAYVYKRFSSEIDRYNSFSKATKAYNSAMKEYNISLEKCNSLTKKSYD